MRKILLIAFRRLVEVVGNWNYWGNLASPYVFVALGLVLSAFQQWALAQPVWRGADSPPVSALATDVTISRGSLTVLGAFRFSWAAFADPVGVVDEAGLIRLLPPDAPAGKLLRYASQAEALEALHVGKIAGYYVIPADYVAGAQAVYYTPIPAFLPATDQAIQRLLMANLAQAPDPARAWRAASPAEVRTRTASASLGAEHALLLGFIRLGVVMTISMMLMSISRNTGAYWIYFLQSRHERDVLELLLTSVSDRQYLLGKLLATLPLCALETVSPLAALGLANAAWALAYPAVLQLGGGLAEAARQVPPVPASQAVVIMVCLLGGVLVLYGLFAIIGVLVRSSEEAGEITANLFWLWMVLGLALLATAVSPNALLMLTLSFTPFFSAFFMPARLLAGSVPAWQVGLSLGLTAATVVLCLALAIHLFGVKRRRWGLV